MGTKGQMGRQGGFVCFYFGLSLVFGLVFFLIYIYIHTHRVQVSLKK